MGQRLLIADAPPCLLLPMACVPPRRAWLRGGTWRASLSPASGRRRHELKALVGLHGETREGEEGEVPLTLDEVQVRDCCC